MLPPQLIDRAPGIGFFQDRDDLCFGELRLTQGNLLARVTILPECSPFDCLDLGGAYCLISREHYSVLKVVSISREAA